MKKKAKKNVIEGNYSLMNINQQKEIGSNLKKKIKEFKKGVKSDKFFFNVNKKLSQSPSHKRNNII